MITRDEFEKRWMKNSGISEEEFREEWVSLPCDCGEDRCKGWAVISNDDLSIRTHLELYGVKDEE